MKAAIILCVALSVLGLAYAAPPSDEAKPQGKQKSASKSRTKTVQVHVFDRDGKLVGPLESEKVLLMRKDWKQKLSKDQFDVLRSKDTERPFCGMLVNHKVPGVYTCAGCGLPLFSSDAKFESNTGWPSFFQPIADSNITDRIDRSKREIRREINCARCDGHLGHVFDDGPPPTGRRYCVNSASLTFTPNDRLKSLADPRAEEATKKQIANSSGGSSE